MFGLVPFGFGKDVANTNDAFDHFFDSFNSFNEPFFQGFQDKGFKVDVKDNGDSYELTADLPGFSKDDVKLNYENGYLTVAAEKKDAKDEKDDKGNFIRRERSFGSVSRSFYMSDVDEKKAQAAFKDGVLTVTMPKAPEKVETGHTIAIEG